MFAVFRFVSDPSAPLDKSRYDFVFDRLRAVRQDLSVRGCRDARAVASLRVCVRFHLYAGYRLGPLPASEFDPVTNFRHALECVKTLLGLLQEGQAAAVDPAGEMSAAYLMLNLGSHESTKWGLAQDQSIR